MTKQKLIEVGGALLWLAMLGATSTTTITGLFCY